MEYYRVSESFFHDVKDYPFDAHYVDINGLRMHYIDEGQGGASTILLMHGVPTWSYLYRHIIPECSAAGNRVIAPDLVGFGKSDKPKKKKNHTYRSHVEWMTLFIESLDLKRIVLFAQDWGVLIGLRLAAENQERFAAIIVSNGMLPTGDQNLPLAFKAWKNFTRFSPWLPVDRIIALGTVRDLDEDEKRAYRAPFPSPGTKAGARALPGLVPVSQHDPENKANLKAWKILEKWNKPFHTVFSDSDPITRRGEEYFREKIRGAYHHKPIPGGHFIQEDAALELSTIINGVARSVAQRIVESA